MVFFIDEARSRPTPPHPPRLLTNVNKKMVFFIEGFPKGEVERINSIPLLVTIGEGGTEKIDKKWPL